MKSRRGHPLAVEIASATVLARGPLYAQLADAIDAAVKAGHLDRPTRGAVRACKPDPTAYTTDDWRHALLAVLGPPTDREDALRAAADWARGHCGLGFTRLRADGHIMTGLRSALSSAIRAKLITRIDATREEQEFHRPALLAEEDEQRAAADVAAQGLGVEAAQPVEAPPQIDQVEPDCQAPLKLTPSAPARLTPPRCSVVGLG